MSANPLMPASAGGQVPGAPPIPIGRFKPIDPLRVLRQHVMLLSVVAVVGVITGVGVFFVLSRTVPKWASSAQLRLSEGVADPEKMRTGDIFTGSPASMEAYIKSEVYKIQSEVVLQEAIGKPQVRNSDWYADYQKDDGAYDFNKAREDLVDDHLNVSMIRGTQLINVSVHTPYKEDCQKIVGAIVSVYLQRARGETTNLVVGRRSSLLTERNRFENDVTRLTKQLEDYTRDNNMTNLDSRLEEAALVRQLKINDREEMNKELSSLDKAYQAALAKRDAGGPPGAGDIAAASEDQAIMIRDERLMSMREQREVALYTFGENHRMVLNIDRNIAATEAEREREIERLLREREEGNLTGYKQAVESITEVISELDGEILELREELIDLNLHQTKYADYKSQLDRALEGRQRIEEALSEVRMIEKLEDAVPVRLQSSASLPELVFPKIELVVPGVTMLMLALATLAVFLRELMDQSIRSPADIKLLKEAELLGTLPDADEDPSGPSSVERVVEKYPTGLLAESYRQVRTALLGKMDRRGYKTLLIGSAQPGSGVSSVTHNLATSLAYNGRKVVIVDANFRRPTQHLFVDADNDRGLVDLLLYDAALDDMLLTVQDPDISVLPTGRAGDAPPEILEGSGFRTLMADLETRFDIVLIDAPPALLSSECQLLAKHVDAMAVIVRASSDKRGMVDRMFGQFAGQRADLLGVILNGVQSSAGGYFRKSFKDFYRYRENGNAANGRSRRGVLAEAESDTLDVE